ncbi:potassium transporter TrkG [Amaricoccus sp.]|uniref:potassium transporter TrkG n=1 Tax=Amaricoccus sp. TaxID=1872485 RepID=UPI001B63CC22|nr:potassium transporter TrkG [Amaricoccus sp.]MBP7241797.1 TrkH family potassium uptake protein [Amaricoccus sp.]
MQTLRQFPAIAILVLAASAAMAVPALHAARGGHGEAALTFLYSGLFFALVAVLVGLATANRQPRNAARYHLATLLATYVALPVALGAPLVHLVPGLGYGRAYFEMLSALSTTGATLIDSPRLVPESVHLWRAMVGWAGGLLVLVSVFAILAPLNLGGFEVRDFDETRTVGRRAGDVPEATARILRTAQRITPVYAILTGLLTLLLIAAGDRPFVAACHAMATLSTSGVSPVGGLSGAASGVLGEAAIAIFLLTAVSHGFLSLRPRLGRQFGLDDPEVRLMLISVLGVTLLLFLRSFIGASEIDRQDNLVAAARAIWGSLFTVLSYLTTTGFESTDWRSMQLWSDLPNPGAILLGVAVMGGGIATTAGGIKLLRLYALYRNGQREMALLIHPSSVLSHGRGPNAITDRGARVAFAFLMMFLVSIAIVMVALTAIGLAFEDGLALAIAALTTTGPAIDALSDGIRYSGMPDAALAVLCAAMIVGRMEVLVLVALFNPALWR